MNLDFNPNYSNNSVNFGALKSISGRERLAEFAGKSGEAACDLIITSMKNNASFDRLCQKFDVNVAITPLLQQLPNSKQLEKSLNIEVYANKLRKNNLFVKLLGIFKRNSKQMPVTQYTAAAGTEVKSYKLAENITENFIKPKEGLEFEVDEFLNKTAHCTR